MSGEARRPGGFRIALGTVHRSLRLQLIAIVVATVATVLAASQWLDTRLSESALDRDRGRSAASCRPWSPATAT